MNSNDSYNFQKLTPIHDVDLSVYEKAIDFVFDNADITNVAISGPYSAGKSSVLESYKKKHDKIKFLHISLAHFESFDKNNEKNSDKNSDKESVLEGKILNQLIHQISVKKIPQTNFRVKKYTRISEIIGITILLYLFISSVVYLKFSNEIENFVDGLSGGNFKNILSILTSDYSVFIAALIFIIAGLICIYNIVKIQKNKNLFQKVSVQGNTIEIFEKQDESYFDKYLNEVLYLFDRVDVDVIVFEDIDRFNGNGIFERLREVNNLTNVQRKNKKSKLTKLLKKNKPLRFFYLLRDDLFITKDRTKFFDYIVPIVPVLDGSNSYDLFVRHLKDGKIFEKFDQGFLQSLSLYIDDMRVLKNIYNEFVVYINRINNTELDWNKMLAMIVYKNMFPRDFSNLQLAKGYVYELFVQKWRFSKDYIEQLEQKKKNLQDEMHIIKQEVAYSSQELDDIYKAKIDRLPEARYYDNAAAKERQKRQQELEKEKNLRKKTVEDRQGVFSEYEKNILEIELQIVHAQNMSLGKLITRENEDKVFNISHVNPLGVGDEEKYTYIKENDYFDLLKFLIRFGYIDETYNDYMTYFYEDSLTAHDKTFLRRITDRRGADYEYSLKDVRKVISSPILSKVDFEEEETLNFDLLNGILSNCANPKYQEYLEMLIEQIKTNKKKDFLSKYFASDKFRNTFIEKLNEHWPECFSHIVKDDEFSLEQRRRFSLETLCLSDEQILNQVNYDNCLRDYISGQEDYLDIKYPNVDKIISQFHILNVKFKSIIFEKSYRKLFDRVYEDNLYELTFDNIAMMLKTQYGITDHTDIIHKNYTLIESKPESPLAFYVEENIQLYLEEDFENCKGKIEDDEKEALAILNNNLVEDDLKERYISLLKTSISVIDKIENTELWGLLIANHIVKKIVSNVMHYFQKYSMDDTLVQFINGFDLDTDFTGIAEHLGEETTVNFFDSVAINNDVKTGLYEKILNGLGYRFDSYDVDSIADDKMEVLLKNKIIEMDEDGLKYMRNHYENHLMFFIENNLEDYLKILTSGNFIHDEAVQVLEFDFDDDKKIEMLQNTKEPITVVDKRYSEKLMAYIIGNNFHDGDAEYLYQNYSQYGELVRDAVYKVADEQIDEISDIDDMLLSDIIKRSSNNLNKKIQLWARMLPRLNKETCKKHFDELGFPQLKGIFTRKNTASRKYEKNEHVTAILKVLKDNSWIHDYYVSEENVNQYIAIKNPPKK